MVATTAQQVIREVNTLRSMWITRQTEFARWYRMIALHNDLKQDQMESVIGSDPRAGFNMAQWLLTPRTSAFVVDSEGFTEQQSQVVGRVERYADRQFAKINRKKRTSLFGSPTRRLVGLMLATGWYAVASIPTEFGWAHEVWNPAQVYPQYNSEGMLVQVGRAYTLTSAEANLRIAQNPDWIRPSTPFMGRTVDVKVLWTLTQHGPVHSIVYGLNLVKRPTLVPLNHIPILTGPVGGLPDDGSIITGDSWRAHVGESLISPIMDIQKNYDKMLTFMQQLVRDTANPRWVEKVKGEGVLTPEKLTQRGAIFTIEPDEDIGSMSVPPLPTELRTHLFDLHNQVQRGLFSDISFGNITQAVSGFLMSQVTSAAKQTLNPFHQSVIDIHGEMATRNIATMRDWGIDMDGVNFPQLPKEIDLDFRYDVEIPGDFIQRVSAGRVANPMFRLSTATIHNTLFPEVQNTAVEQARLRTEDATQTPVFQQILILRELSRAAREARNHNDEEMAEWLDRAVSIVEAQSLQPGGPESEGGDVSSGVGPETLPPEVQEILAGRG
jgi:hypothetical protein